MNITPEQLREFRSLFRSLVAAIKHDGKGIDLANADERHTWNKDAHVEVTLTAGEVFQIIDCAARLPALIAAAEKCERYEKAMEFYAAQAEGISDRAHKALGSEPQ